MSGTKVFKRIRKPQDLYSFSNENVKKSIMDKDYSGDEALQFLKDIGVEKLK